MLCGLLAVLQAAFVDSVFLDPFWLLQDLVATSEVDVGGCQVFQAVVISPVIVVADEPADLALEIAGEEVVFQQDAVLEGLVPSFDLALGVGMVRSTTDMIHALVFQPFSQFGSDVTGAIVRQQPWSMMDVHPITA